MSSIAEEVVIEDDNVSMVYYYPSDVWQSENASFRHGKSYHGTFTSGAYVTFTFNGSYVAYYSDMNKDHGLFAAAVDGRSIMQGTSYSSTWVSDVLHFSTFVEP
ncbi:hypothetical protein AURDEDRAFT_164276 [Auricularia subglabra TFB-10046 SS5]|nr:hypothetical protein AURDEDRAFT_164276 [Auricularia subglabra TFB-10046 SS5]